MPIDILLRVKDEEATSRIKSFANKAEGETRRATGSMRRDFKNLAQDISRDMAGSAGSIVGSIGRVGGAFGILTATVLGTGFAFVRLAKNAAEAMDDAKGQKFLGLLDRIEARVKGIGNSLGEEIVARINGPVGQGLIKLIGLEESAAEMLARWQRERKAEFDAARAAKLAEIEGSMKRSEAILQEIRLNNILKKMEAELTAARKRAREEQFEAQQKFREQEIANATLRFEAERDFLQAEMQGIDQVGASIQQMNERLDDEEAKQARAEFLTEVEKGSKKASFEVDRLADSMAQLAQAIASTARSGGGFFDILPSLINIAFSYFSKGGFPLQFANGGIIGAQNGLIVKRPTLFMAGENFKPEAIVPLAADKGNQRNAVMQAAGLSDRGNITVVNNFNVPAIDPVTIRNLLLPEINRQIRRGEKLLASELR